MARSAAADEVFHALSNPTRRKVLERLSVGPATVSELAAQLIGARNPLMSFGISMLGPALLKYGNEEQKRRFLPEIARGEIRWCQGYSEPNAGSDLAALQTKCEDKGDHWLVNGQKVWTSYADQADWIFCLVRTDKTSKQGGISFLLFDMASEGVSTKPILLISGYSPFCETFFDNVKVPKANRVHDENKGWDVAKYLLGHEREMISGMGLGARGEDPLVEAARRGVDPILRAQIALFEVRSQAFKAMSERFIDELKAGRAHPAQPSMMKYYGTELNKTRHELIMAAGGSDTLEWESEGSNHGAAPRAPHRDRSADRAPGRAGALRELCAPVLRSGGRGTAAGRSRPRESSGSRAGRSGAWGSSPSCPRTRAPRLRSVRGPRHCDAAGAPARTSCGATHAGNRNGC